MHHATAIVCAIAALAPVASAGITSLNFTSNPTIENSAPLMQVLGNGSVIGRGLDGSDQVRYQGVGFANGQFFDAVLTVVDAEKRTAIAFSGGGTTVNEVFNTTNDAVINLSNANNTGTFGPEGNTDPETMGPLIAGPSSETQRTSARIRMDFVITGTTTLIDPSIDVGLSFFDIAGASSGANRGRVDGLTLFGTDSVFTSPATVMDVDTSVPGATTLQSSLGRVQAPVADRQQFAASALWSDVNSIEFEWFFDWSANGTRGVNFSGNFLIPSPGAAALMGFAGLAATRRRRSA